MPSSEPNAAACQKSALESGLSCVETFLVKGQRCWGSKAQCNRGANNSPSNPPPKAKQAPEEWGQALLAAAERTQLQQTSCSGFQQIFEASPFVWKQQRIWNLSPCVIRC